MWFVFLKAENEITDFLFFSSGIFHEIHLFKRIDRVKPPKTMEFPELSSELSF